MKNEYIYFIQEGLEGNIKIGFSNKPAERLKTLQTSHSRTLRLLLTIEGNEKDEKNLHAKFSRFRLKGEWFEPNEEILVYIEENKTGDTRFNSLIENVNSLKEDIEILKKENKQKDKIIEKLSNDSLNINEVFEGVFHSSVDKNIDGVYTLYPLINISGFKHIEIHRKPMLCVMIIRGGIFLPFMEFKEIRETQIDSSVDYSVLDFLAKITSNIFNEDNFYFVNNYNVDPDYDEYYNYLIETLNDFDFTQDLAMQIRVEMQDINMCYLSRKELDEPQERLEPSFLEPEEGKKRNSTVLKINS